MDVSLNTYVRYKQLQKTFTTWLTGAAEKCGEKVGVLSKNDQVKGRQLPLDYHVRLATAVAAKTIRRIWSLYDASNISLVNASLLTNTAIEMIRSNCHNQLRAMEGLPFTPDKEEAVSQWVFAHLGGDPDTWENWTHDEWKLAEWCCHSTWSILRSHMDDTEAGRLSFFRPKGDEDVEWGERESERAVKLPGKKRYDNDSLWSTLMCSDFYNFTLLHCSDDLPPSLDWITGFWKEIDYRKTTLPL